MGSCQSTPTEATTGSSHVKKTLVEDNKPSPTLASASASSKTTNTSAQSPASAPSSPNNHSHKLSPEETDHTSHGSAEDPASPHEDEMGEKASTSPMVVPLKDDDLPNSKNAMKSQHSSMSSYDSCASPRDNSNHLAEWKNELAAGDLSTAVVRIETEFGRPIEEVYSGVHDGPVLGSGVSGIVRLVKHRSTGVSYAVKCLDVGLLQDANGYERLKDEVFIMCKLDHPNIVRLEEVYESQSELFLIQELCMGGDLFDRLDEQPDIHYTEAQCARLVKQILSSVRYLHSKNIIHRDLKLENFLFSSNKTGSELKMIDFGLSKHFCNGEIHHEQVGTPYSVAPEVIRGEYDERCDMWSLGVITYLLLSGETPFGGANGEALSSVRENILCGQVNFEPSEIWDNVSDTGKAFVKRLLNPNSSQRPTAKDAQRDIWIRHFGKMDCKEGKSLSPNIASALVEFKEYSDMRKMLCEVLSFTLLPEQIVELRGEFEKMDTNGDGEISLSALKHVFMESAESGALGALTEVEVEDIFNALRVRKTEPTIRWHEFIAASLSQCSFDERNLKLAFDRLDYDRKGFITFDDMKELLGSGEDGDDDAFHEMWDTGVNEWHCPLERITYEDFLRVMKGQSRETPEGTKRGLSRRSSASTRRSLDSNMLEAVPEGCTSPSANRLPRKSIATMNIDIPQMPMLGQAEDDISFPTDIPLAAHKRTRSKSLEGTSVDWNLYEPLATPPPPPPPPISPFSDVAFMPRSPVSARRSCFASTDAHSIPRSPMSPRRSCFAVRIAMDELEEAIKDDSKTPLVVNRALYRKHREIRQSVLAASKLFDEKRLERKLSECKLGGRKAGLVMRRESVARAMPSPGELKIFDNRRLSMPVNVPLPLLSEGGQRGGQLSKSDHPVGVPTSILTKSEHEDMHKVEEASRRSGRPRRQRVKTHSDMTGMMKGL